MCCGLFLFEFNCSIEINYVNKYIEIINLILLLSHEY